MKSFFTVLVGQLGGGGGFVQGHESDLYSLLQLFLYFFIVYITISFGVIGFSFFQCQEEELWQVIR